MHAAWVARIEAAHESLVEIETEASVRRLTEALLFAATPLESLLFRKFSCALTS